MIYVSKYGNALETNRIKDNELCRTLTNSTTAAHAETKRHVQPESRDLLSDPFPRDARLACFRETNMTNNWTIYTDLSRGGEGTGPKPVRQEGSKPAS